MQLYCAIHNFYLRSIELDLTFLKFQNLMNLKLFGKIKGSVHLFCKGLNSQD